MRWWHVIVLADVLLEVGVLLILVWHWHHIWWRTLHVVANYMRWVTLLWKWWTTWSHNRGSLVHVWTRLSVSWNSTLKLLWSKWTSRLHSHRRILASISTRLLSWTRLIILWIILKRRLLLSLLELVLRDGCLMKVTHVSWSLPIIRLLLSRKWSLMHRSCASV